MTLIIDSVIVGLILPVAARVRFLSPLQRLLIH